MSDSTWKQYTTVECTISGIHGQSHLCSVSSGINSACDKSSFIVLKQNNDEQFTPKILKIKIEKDESKMIGNCLSVCSCASSRIWRSPKEQADSTSENLDACSTRETILASFIDQDKLAKLVRNSWVNVFLSYLRGITGRH